MVGEAMHWAVARLVKITLLAMLIGVLIFGSAGYVLGRYVESKKNAQMVEDYRNELIAKKVEFNAAMLDSLTSKIK